MELNTVMDIKSIIYPVAALSSMGLLFGILLAFASKIFAVDSDERLPRVLEALPGANCGGCGYAGCSNYASEVVSGNAKVNKCPVGGMKTARKIAEIMGVAADEQIRYVAHVYCRGGNNTKIKYKYKGIEDCISASKLSGGPSECDYGCLGYGTCVGECQFGALSVKDGVAVVDREKCTACKKCTAICPRHIIALVPYLSGVQVGCMSQDKGAATKSICGIGCVGCRICEKKCPAGAI
ncbi:MAG: RnfABCDGE type electron transport complex subunit B [Bacillota bacterium]|nr:RnfABCDGE type electron transport complex subunit B [Bacillota bacterium]